MKMFNRFNVRAAAVVLLMAAAVFAQELPQIAVYVTGNAGTDEKDALGTRMLASLVNSGRYVAIERSSSFLAEIEKEHIKQRSGAIDDSQISEFGKMFGVKFVCIADITSAFGEFQVSARIVNVETAQVVFIGESASPLKSMADLARVSDRVVKNMFGEQEIPAPNAASKPSLPTQSQYNPAQSQYKNFTNRQRLGTFGLNLLVPGAGSIAIMQDWGGAVTQWVLLGGGIICMVNGIDTHGETDDYTETYSEYSEPNALFAAGVVAVLANAMFNLMRSVSYNKKMPKNIVSLENSGLNVAILPYQGGNIMGYVAYRMEF